LILSGRAFFIFDEKPSPEDALATQRQDRPFPYRFPDAQALCDRQFLNEACRAVAHLFDEEKL